MNTTTGIAIRWLCLTLFPALMGAGVVMGQAHRGLYALTNARIETVTNGTIERGTVLMRNERIEAVGAFVPIPAEAEVIDCGGKTIYPGMIDGGTRLGLIEVGSLPETRDDDELGDVTPQASALTAVNPNSVSIPVTRANGVTTVVSAPGGGLFPGTAALINLVGYTPEQMDAGCRMVVMNFPATARSSRGRRRRQGVDDSAAAKARARLDMIWDRAVLMAHLDSLRATSVDLPGRREYLPEIDALLPVVRGERPLLIEVNAAQDIDSALAWVSRRRVRAIFSGVQEGWRVADRIASARIPCVVGPVLTLPSRESDRYDKPYRNAALLVGAGVDIAFRTNESSNVRNLPYHVGFAVAYGLDRNAALKAITISAARIFGVDRDLGSIEVGKRATLFVADGDPLEPSTNVTDLFIDGYRLPTTSRHVELYREFLDRSPGLTR